jgi:hypothetical protein
MIQPALDSIHFHKVSTDLSIPMMVHRCLMIAGIVLAVPAALALESVRHLAGGTNRSRSDPPADGHESVRAGRNCRTRAWA